MEYAFYAEQIYRLKEGIVQARVLMPRRRKHLAMRTVIQPRSRRADCM